MALVVPDVGEIVLLQYLLKMTTPTDPVLHLYNNDVTPSESTILSNLTEPSGSTGYAAVTLPGTSWTTTQVAGVTTGVFSERTFTFTTGVSIYGYYVTNTAGALLWAERFGGAPFALPDGGGQIGQSPRITLD